MAKELKAQISVSHAESIREVGRVWDREKNVALLHVYRFVVSDGPSLVNLQETQRKSVSHTDSFHKTNMFHIHNIHVSGGFSVVNMTVP